MNYEEKQVETAAVEDALRHFRQSVHGWSEQELGRVREADSARPHGWFAGMRTPIAGWALACAIAVTAVTVPVSVHRQREQAAQRQAAIDSARRQAEEAAAQKLANSISDEELLNHVDSDVAQATPEALEPLASLMSDSNE